MAHQSGSAVGRFDARLQRRLFGIAVPCPASRPFPSSRCDDGQFDWVFVAVRLEFQVGSSIGSGANRRSTTRRGWTIPTSLLLGRVFWLRAICQVIHHFLLLRWGCHRSSVQQIFHQPRRRVDPLAIRELNAPVRMHKRHHRSTIIVQGVSHFPDLVVNLHPEVKVDPGFVRLLEAGGAFVHELFKLVSPSNQSTNDIDDVGSCGFPTESSADCWYVCFHRDFGRC